MDSPLDSTQDDSSKSTYGAAGHALPAKIAKVANVATRTTATASSATADPDGANDCDQPALPTEEWLRSAALQQKLCFFTASGDSVKVKDPNALAAAMDLLRVTDEQQQAAVQSMPDSLSWPILSMATPDGWAKCAVQPDQVQGVEAEGLLQPQPQQQNTGVKRPASSLEE